MKALKAAVIGLGNIGFQFNLEPLRKGVHSHVVAYERCAKTELVAVVEINEKNIAIFKQYYKEVPVFNTVKELMTNIKDVDIVSICTTTDTHYTLLKETLRYPIKAIFCEKPIANTPTQAEVMIQLCKTRKVILTVNHGRRWDTNYLFVKDAIQRGRIGKIKAISALYSGHVFNMGTHLFDTIRMLIEKDAYVVNGFSSNIEDPDPNISGWIQFDGNIPCVVVAIGKREDFIFEIDVIGNEGRIRILENGSKIEMFSFANSKRYSDYRELTPAAIRYIPKKDKFIEAVSDMVAVIEGRKENVECSGKDGLAALVLSYSMLKSAKLKKTIKLKCLN